MDPVTIGLLVSAGVGLIGRAVSEGNLAEARRLRQQMLDQYGPDAAPVLDTVIAQEVGPSAMNSIKGDPRLRNSQTEVLDELRNVYESEGMTSADKAALQLAQNEAAGRAGADYANNNIRLAQQGQQGNAVLSSALAANAGQTATGAVANQGLQAQVAARARALRALEAEGNLAGDVRGQDFGEQSAVAKANDAVNVFNAGQRTDAANQRNANAVTGFNAKMSLANARAGVMGQQAAGEEATAARAGQTAAGVGNAVNQGASAYSRYLEEQKRNGGK